MAPVAGRKARTTSYGVDADTEVSRRQVELREGRLRLVVVADTHSSPHPNAAPLIASETPDAIVHAGDIGELGVLSELEKIAPVHAVRGNIDARVTDVPDLLTLDVMSSGVNAFRILMTHIAVYGPKLRGDAAMLARREGAKLVICGHSHVPFIGSDRGLGVFNPGSIGPRRFQLPIVFGVLEIENGRLKMHHVDCETGKTWLP